MTLFNVPRQLPRLLALFVIGYLTCSPGSHPATADAAEPDGFAAAIALEKTFVDAIAKAEVSVVSIARVRIGRKTIARENENPFRLNFQEAEIQRDVDNPSSPDFIPSDFGAGIIVAPSWNAGERFILTNYHVVKGGPIVRKDAGRNGITHLLYVRFADRRGYYASIIAADPRSDLAILKIDFNALGIKPEDLKPITLAGDAPLRKGQIVMALGNPYAIGRDGSASASWGMISNITRRPAPTGPVYDEDARRKETVHHYGTLLQVDARLQLGASGGAVINLKGELVGLPTSLAALEGYEKSVGFAIPIDAAARRIIDSLAHGYEVEYGFLGVTPRDVTPDGMSRLSGKFQQSTAAVAIDVHANSPAFSAGLKPGDVILEVDGVQVLDKYDLMRRVGLLGPSTDARLKVWRERTQSELSMVVRLGKWPVYDDEGLIATATRLPPWRGIVVDYPTSRQKFLQYPFRYHRAVVVLSSPRGRDGDVAPLQPGDFITHVNGTPVHSPAEFHRTVAGIAKDATLQLIDGRRVVIKN